MKGIRTYPRALLYALVCSGLIFLLNVLVRGENLRTAGNGAVVFFLVIGLFVCASVWLRNRSRHSSR